MFCECGAGVVRTGMLAIGRVSDGRGDCGGLLGDGWEERRGWTSSSSGVKTPSDEVGP